MTDRKVSTQETRALHPTHQSVVDCESQNGHDCNCGLAALRKQLEEAQRERDDDSIMYRKTLKDLHAMCGREGEPTTHGLDYTTILGARIKALRSRLAALEEAAREVLDPDPWGKTRSSVAPEALAKLRAALAPVEQREEATCKWRESGRLLISSCGMNRPLEVSVYMRFCPYCGHRIEVVAEGGGR